MSGNSTCVIPYYSAGYYRSGLLNNGYFKLQTQVDGIDVAIVFLLEITDTGATSEALH